MRVLKLRGVGDLEVLTSEAEKLLRTSFWVSEWANGVLRAVQL